MSSGFAWVRLRSTVACGWFLAAVSCGGQSVERHETPDRRGEVGDECTGLYDDSCGEGLSCFGSPACDAVWTCEASLPPCSSAAPFTVCGCDGRVGTRAAGCPEPYLYSLEGYPLMNQLGALCDVARTEPPERVALSIHLHGFDAYPLVYLRAGDGSAAATTGFERGESQIDFDGVMHSPGLYYLAVFADAGEDLLCIDGVDRMGMVQPYAFSALTMTASYDFGPEDLTLGCSDW